jgi:hypothetical protein
MSANVLMISEQSFKDFTVASANIDLKNVTQVIKMTQDRYIHPICGTALYDKILTLISNGTIGSGGNAVYKTFLDSYLTDTLFNYVLGELPMAMQYKFVNKGIVKRKSENITEPTFAELQSISQYYKGYAEWYAERAINYLCANSEQYPEYLNPGSDVTTIQPVSNQYKVAINLGRGKYEDHRPYSERYQGNRYKKDRKSTRLNSSHVAIAG